MSSDQLRQVLESRKVGAHVLPDRGVRAPARFYGPDAIRGESIVSDQVLGILLSENVVGDNRQRLVKERSAELQHKRGLPRANWS